MGNVDCQVGKGERVRDKSPDLLRLYDVEDDVEGNDPLQDNSLACMKGDRVRTSAWEAGAVASLWMSRCLSVDLSRDSARKLAAFLLQAADETPEFKREEVGT